MHPSNWEDKHAHEAASTAKESTTEEGGKKVKVPKVKAPKRTAPKPKAAAEEDSMADSSEVRAALLT